MMEKSKYWEWKVSRNAKKKLSYLTIDLIILITPYVNHLIRSSTVFNSGKLVFYLFTFWVLNVLSKYSKNADQQILFILANLFDVFVPVQDQHQIKWYSRNPIFYINIWLPIVWTPQMMALKSVWIHDWLNKDQHRLVENKCKHQIFYLRIYAQQLDATVKRMCILLPVFSNRINVDKCHTNIPFVYLCIIQYALSDEILTNLRKQM